MSRLVRLLRGESPGVRLFLLAALTLYLELALIRFTSAEVLYLGYFANFVLISVFLGIGLGFLAGKRKVELFRHAPVLVLFLVAFVLLTRVDASYLRDHLGQLFFGGDRRLTSLPLWLALPVIFVSTVLLFAAIAQETARCFPAFKPIVAYSIDIAGSLTGIALFTLHAYVGATPTVWMGVSLAVIALLSPKRTWIPALLAGAGVLLLLAAVRPDHYTRWSPYQRIEVWERQLADGTRYLELNANGILHQNMMPVGRGEPIYDFPYTIVTELRDGRGYDNVLIVGAGTGTDVAYALAAGAAHVDAVEIDPVILDAGVLYHPSMPYQDGRVAAHADDGRAFMQRTEREYDLIVFALPDSLASLSNFANIRLESFLFTRESFEQARDLLADDGVVVLYNYYRKGWLVRKLADMQAQVHGHDPVIVEYAGERGGMLVAMAVGPELAGPPYQGPRARPATDDWPFLYLQNATVPPMYLWLMALFIGCALLGVGVTGNLRAGAAWTHAPFVLMGAAFLLLETKAVIQFSLLFGATWLVNSLVFFAVLCSVLLANLLVVRLNLRRPVLLIGLLLASLAVQYAIPLSALLGIEIDVLRYVVASVLLFSPIFFANLLFGTLFRDTPMSSVAFGWNIIGTMIGGALEYTSMGLGYRSLTLVIAVLYGLCALAVVIQLRRGGASAPAPAST